MNGQHFVVIERYQSGGIAIRGPFDTYEAAMEEMRRPPTIYVVSKSLCQVLAVRIGNDPVFEHPKL